jgi:hypothetical protein
VLLLLLPQLNALWIGPECRTCCESMPSAADAEALTAADAFFRDSFRPSAVAAAANAAFVQLPAAAPAAVGEPGAGDVDLLRGLALALLLPS